MPSTEDGGIQYRWAAPLLPEESMTIHDAGARAVTFL
jgi:hypothetical protein